MLNVLLPQKSVVDDNQGHHFSFVRDKKKHQKTLSLHYYIDSDDNEINHN